MSYRNKTYVAFASEDIKSYWLMTAWHKNENIEFDFFDAHNLNTALDTSRPDTIRLRLRERLANTKQVVLLGSSKGKAKAGNGNSFLFYEVEVIAKLNLPVVVANLDGDRNIDENFIPQRFLDDNYYTMSVSFQPKIIKYALDGYVTAFATGKNSGPHYYEAETYTKLGLQQR
ncbi:TIR domain-containing protein [Amycolatopsis sp. cmx-11-51]|uniref:TIR domain-containing protein n=1 Tax=Amycolatopsis sp. cmx-11-51 TaxID=2785797 RepID=UPI0039E3B274